MNFSQALDRVKNGAKIRRSFWDPSAFVYLVPGSSFVVNRKPLLALLGILEPGTAVSYAPHLDARQADGTFAVWSPSQAAVLAEDWEVIVE